MKKDYRYLNCKVWLKAVALVAFSICVVWFEGAVSGDVIASPLQQQALSPNAHTLLAYNIDYGMDQARGDQTLEYYGENEDFGDKLRDIIEQTLRNNVNHPDSKDTAENSYKRESTLNNLLPEKRSSAFSKDDLSKLRKTQNPKEMLK